MSPEPVAQKSFSIRECRLDDLDRIVEIERLAFPDPYDRFTFEQLLELEPNGFLVAEGKCELLGYVTAVTRGDEAMIYSIAIAPDNRRAGIGRRLMRSELNYLSKKATIVELQVSVKNHAAIALYKQFFFVVVGKVRRYYRNGDDALVMRLEIAPNLPTRQ